MISSNLNVNRSANEASVGVRICHGNAIVLAFAGVNRAWKQEAHPLCCAGFALLVALAQFTY